MGRRGATPLRAKIRSRKLIYDATLMSVTERALQGEEKQVLKDLKELGIQVIHERDLLKAATKLRLPACLFSQESSEAESTKRFEEVENDEEAFEGGLNSN